MTSSVKDILQKVNETRQNITSITNIRCVFELYIHIQPTRMLFLTTLNFRWRHQ